MSLKDLPQNPSLGERLRARRIELGLSVKDMAHEMQAPAKVVEAFEAGNYSLFSAKVYAAGYFRKILSILAMENSDALLGEFANEWEVGSAKKMNSRACRRTGARSPI